MIKNILFTGDVARPLSQKGNIEFFFYLLRRVLFDVTHIQPEVLSDPSEHLTLDSWKKNQVDGPYEVSEVIEDLDLSESLVIGFELSFRQIQHLKRNKICFVNFEIAPIRFLSDLALALDTSFNVDERFLISEKEIYDETDYVRACLIKSKMKPFDVHADSKLIVGQWTNDRSLIKPDGSGFYELKDFKSTIDERCRGFHIAYKEHPYWPNFYSFCDLYRSAIDVSDANIYQLLCNPNIKEVIGISSSVLSEAVYFQKSVVRLASSPDTNSGHMISAADFLSFDFWNHLLFGAPFSRKAQRERNFLRKSIGSWWGYPFIS